MRALPLQNLMLVVAGGVAAAAAAAAAVAVAVVAVAVVVIVMLMVLLLLIMMVIGRHGRHASMSASRAATSSCYRRVLPPDAWRQRPMLPSCSAPTCAP
jgi:hypothetical protein